MKIALWTFALTFFLSISANAKDKRSEVVVDLKTEHHGKVTQKKYELFKVSQKEKKWKIRYFENGKLKTVKHVPDAMGKRIRRKAHRQVWSLNYGGKKLVPKKTCKRVLFINLPRRSEKTEVCAGDVPQLASSKPLIRSLDQLVD